MAEEPYIAPAIQKFLDAALPSDGGTHTLVLGEDHHQTEHYDFLRQHLDELQKQHHLRTIGLELPSYMNLFFWAYQDGTLAQQLHSSKLAKAYIRAVLVAGTNHNFSASTESEVALALAAMDLGIRVVAYDGRDTLRQEVTTEVYKLFRTGGEEAVSQTPNVTFEELQQVIRNSVSLLDRQRASGAKGWMLSEAEWLRDLNPDYKEKLAALEQLVETGHDKIHEGKLSSDALSALLFDAQAVAGNRLTIGGVAHMDGIGYPHQNIAGDYLSPHIENAHGTFGHHLFAMGQSAENQKGHAVTHAIIAGTSVADKMRNKYYNKLRQSKTVGIIDTALTLLNIDRGHVSTLKTHLPEEEAAMALHDAGLHTLAGYAEPKPMTTCHSVPLANKFYTPPVDATPQEKSAHQQQHINPLLIPDLKRAVDMVRELMNEGQAVQTR